MVINAEFLFDFGSPNAYLAHKLIPGIEARTGARFQYTPVLLGGLFKLTNNQSPIVAFSAIPNKMAYEMLEMQRFIDRHGLTTFAMNPHFPINTLTLMRGAVAAEMEDRLAPFAEACFRLIWETSANMGDPAVAEAALSAAGVDAGPLIARARDDDVKARLLHNTEEAAARGAFGAPTFFVDGGMYFGKDRLREVEEAIVRSRSIGSS